MKASLPDTFAAFILTHGRPDNVITVKSLKRHGYTGKVFFIVDNEDKTVHKYVENFGREKVIVFDKKAVADACDEGNNFGERRAILYARNACFEIAKSLGITHFIQLDDDYSEFKFRFEKELSRHWIVFNLDAVIQSFLEFYLATPIKSIAFSQGGDHIGGYSGQTKLKRKCMNSFFCSTERPFQFVGAINEDVNTYTTLGSRGDLFFTFTSVQLDQAQTQSQAGGMTGNYASSGTYIKSFSTVTMMPGSVKVALMNSKNPRIHHLVDWNTTVPCIVSERHRKSTARRRFDELLAETKSRLDQSIIIQDIVAEKVVVKVAKKETSPTIKPENGLDDKWKSNWWQK